MTVGIRPSLAYTAEQEGCIDFRDQSSNRLAQPWKMTPGKKSQQDKDQVLVRHPTLSDFPDSQSMSLHARTIAQPPTAACSRETAIQT